MFLVTFALPDESRAFARRLEGAGDLPYEGVIAGRPVTFTHTGMGAAWAGEVVRQCLLETEYTCVLSSGFAGALDPALKTGDLVASTTHSDPALLATLPAGVKPVRFASSPTALDTPAQKAAFAAATGAAVVDMESDAIAAACRNASVPLVVLRVISDAADESLPLPAQVTYHLERQRIRHAAIVWHLLTHPRTIPALGAFMRRMPGLQRGLADALVGFIAASPAPHLPGAPIPR